MIHIILITVAVTMTVAVTVVVAIIFFLGMAILFNGKPRDLP